MSRHLLSRAFLLFTGRPVTVPNYPSARDPMRLRATSSSTMAVSLPLGSHVDNILFCSRNPLEHIRVQNNYTHYTPAEDEGYSWLGWPWSWINNDVVAPGQLLHRCGIFDQVVKRDMTNVTHASNTICSKSKTIETLAPLPRQSPTTQRTFQTLR